MMSTIIRHAVNAWSGKSFTAGHAEVRMTKENKNLSPPVCVRVARTGRQGNAEVRRVKKTNSLIGFPLRTSALPCGECLLIGLSS